MEKFGLKRFWPHRPEERYGEKTDARKVGRQAEKGQTSNNLVPGFEKMDQAGHCWCITTGDRSGKMAKNHQSHSSKTILNLTLRLAS